MKLKAMLSLSAAVLIILATSAGTVFLFSPNAALAYMNAELKMDSVRGGGDAIPGPMFYTSAEEGMTVGRPGGEIPGLRPTGSWVPGDTHTRVLAVRNIGAYDAWLTSVNATLQAGSDELLAKMLRVTVTADEAGNDVLASGSLFDFIVGKTFSHRIDLPVTTLPWGYQPLFFTVHLPGTADNSYQAKTLWVDFTVRAEEQEPAPTPSGSFVWVANSGEGTVSKLDARSGVELGRYRSAPSSHGPYPIRLAVDSTGSVWVANRHSRIVTKIGLLEAGTCVDRNGNGTIDTSTGATDVRPWPDSGPTDECVLMNVLIPNGKGHGVGMVAVDQADNLYAGSDDSQWLFYLDGESGAILSERNNLAGHSVDGVVDPEGILWIPTGESKRLVRFDPATESLQHIQLPHSAIGLAFDNQGHVWVSGDDPHAGWITKIRRSDGVVLGSFSAEGNHSSGVAADSDGDIWVANTGSNTLSRLAQNGSLKETVQTGPAPVGVAIDADGRVWVTNSGSHDTNRFDPVTETVRTFPVGLTPVDVASAVSAAPPVCNPIRWLSPLSAENPYELPADGTLLIRFTETTCSTLLAKDSVIVAVQDWSNPKEPVTVWVHDWESAIDTSGEYRQEFSPGAYGLPPGTELEVQVFIDHELAGRSPLRIIP